MRGLSTKVAVVTGGGGGIGGATCRRLASEGATVAVFDIDAPSAERTAAAIAADGGKAVAFTCDIADHEGVRSAIAKVNASLGPIDVLVNNAGWDIFKPFLQTSPADWQKLIAINLIGALNMHHAVLPQMVERRSGRVVNIASDAARVGSSGEAVYAACKAGLLGLTKTLAREHARDGITFNVVCPGPTDTALLGDFITAASNPEKLKEAFRRSIPLGRIGSPDDLQGAICFFASDDASFITGQVLSVSGGLTMAG
ncbi:MAG TPA: glucose 1-dehydrogenase [Tardiphaga sp.]